MAITAESHFAPMATQSEFPLRLGDTEDFMRVDAMLRRAQYCEAAICRVLSIPSLSLLGDAHKEGFSATGSPSLALLSRLFLLGEIVPSGDIEHAFDAPAIRSLRALDLIRPTDGKSERESYFATVLLYPVADLFIASDRHENPDGSPFVPPADVVFPAIFAGTLRFLRVVPRSPTSDALDLCAGTGIGALVLSRHVERVVAADITARATHFARFNRLLNGRDNVEIVQGDLYEAVEGRSFDRIIAHPPYVPALSQSQVFRDAGETGEIVLQRIVAGLPRQLRSDGTFCCLSAGWDTAEGPFEERIRGWLGEDAAEFDLVLAEQEEMSPAQVARRLADKSVGEQPLLLERLEQRFASAALERSVYGAIVLHRVPRGVAGGEPVTARVQMSEVTDGLAFEWALRWHRWRATKQAAGDLDAAVLQATLRLGAGLQVKTQQVVEQGQLVQAGIVLESERPFLAATKIEAWMLPLVADFGAGRRAAEVYERAQRSGGLPDGFEAGDFAKLLTAMVERGYLEIDEVAFRG